MSDEADQRARTQAAIAGVWQRLRPTVLERFTRIEQALDILRVGVLDEARCEEAIHEAHKLAGSLGMFGFPAGSVLARELEQALKAGLGAEAAARYAERLRELKLRLEA